MNLLFFVQIAFFIPVSAILLIRAANGAVALYTNKEFAWADDTWFYCLDTLPEFMSLVVLCWPKLLARSSFLLPPCPELMISSSWRETVSNHRMQSLNLANLFP